MSQNTSNPDDFRNPLFSVQDHVKGPVVGSIRLDDLVDVWRNGGDYLRHVLKLRTLADSKAIGKHKTEHIPSVVIGGTCTPFEVPSDSCIVDASQHLCLDCDQGGILCAPESLRSTLESLPFAKVVSRSVSGKAWLVIFHFVGSRKRAEALAANAIDAAVGFSLVSRGQSELSRRRFMTFDPNIFHNLDAEIIHCEVEDPPRPEILTPADAPDLAEIKSAFAHVNPFRDAAEWRKIVWGVRASCGEEAREICQQWSSGELLDNKGQPWPEAESTEHGYDADEFMRQWDRADRSSGGSTARTLFGLAHEGGWKGAPVGGGDFDAVPVELIADDEAPTKKKRRADFQAADSIPEFRVPWLWPQVIPKGMLTMLAGRQGLGKSFLICDLAARLSIGNALPDGTEHAPMRVLLLAREDIAGCVLVPRLRVAGAALSHVTIATFRDADTGAVLDLVEDIDLIREEHARKPFGLIVVDTFGAFAGDTDANDQGEVRLFLDALSRLAADTGAAVVVVAHPRKSGAAGGDIMDSIAGSVQMTAGVRVALLLTGDPDTTTRELSVAKSNLGARGSKWVWKFADKDQFADTDEPPRIEWKGMITAQASLETKLINAIRANPEATQRELATVIKVNHGSLVKPFARLRESGMVQEGVSLLTVKGEKAFIDGLF